MMKEGEEDGQKREEEGSDGTELDFLMVKDKGQITIVGMGSIQRAGCPLP